VASRAIGTIDAQGFREIGVRTCLAEAHINNQRGRRRLSVIQMPRSGGGLVSGRKREVLRASGTTEMEGLGHELELPMAPAGAKEKRV